MRTETRQFLSLVSLATIGAALLITDTHRKIIGWGFEYALAFYTTYIAF
jgi:hypothetical protein